MKSPKIDLKDYQYHLPEDKIAKKPCEPRDASKLLVFKNRSIEESIFRKLPAFLPPNSTLFFNDTKVIQARLIFEKTTGARIEIFLLEPVSPHRDIHLAMSAQSPTRWKCMIGNLKKWKDGQVLTQSIEIGTRSLEVRASITDRDNQIVELSWDGDFSCSRIAEAIGKTPLPPYIKRQAEESDKIKYQTVYSKYDGAVAAPTAGLHFTETLLKVLQKDHKSSYLTLHVSAGTFQPISVDEVIDHPMHSEQIHIRRQNILDILSSRYPIAVGTTSLRTLESLYWYGVLLEEDFDKPFSVPKLFPYENQAIPLKKSMENVLRRMDFLQCDELNGNTEIFVFPGYKSRVAKGLITNFHLPGSTLILLVAALIGEDWKSVYDYALKSNFRFLSYGDSSVLLT